MPRVLITGGTGTLGRELVPRFATARHDVRILSRRPAPPDKHPTAEWAQAQIENGEGLPEAVQGVDTIVHCASSPFRQTEAVDVDGTERLLKAAREAGVSHLFYISIVGIDRIPLPYYKHKLAAEALVQEGGVPWSILRATQFHYLIDGFLGTLLRLPVGLVPTSFRFQPIYAGDVADRMVEDASGDPAGRLPDLGGPEVFTMGELARTWLAARRLRRWIAPLPLFGKVAAGFKAGYNCTPENAYGKVTWIDWLRTKYGRPDPSEEVST